MSLFDVKSGPHCAWAALGGVEGSVHAGGARMPSPLMATGSTPMKAEIAGRKDNIDHLRITRVALDPESRRGHRLAAMRG